ncbi:MAG: hypothetical protein MK089_08195 [Phycisphaerales bacterium]|nr:hypothetical protein [Phycisphaerales bacterium]
MMNLALIFKFIFITSGITLAIHLGEEPDSVEPTVVMDAPTPTALDLDEIDTPIFKVASTLGLAEYYCYWPRFRFGAIMLMTDTAIEMNGQIEKIRESVSDEDAFKVAGEFAGLHADKLTAELSKMTVANGLDSSADWAFFSQSACSQMIQRIIDGEDNWPHMGQVLADQAVALVREGQDRKWAEFGEDVGTSLQSGTSTQWRQWGRQVGLQARARVAEPKVDWEQFGRDIVQQARWMAARLKDD